MDMLFHCPATSSYLYFAMLSPAMVCNGTPPSARKSAVSVRPFQLTACPVPSWERFMARKRSSRAKRRDGVMGLPLDQNGVKAASNTAGVSMVASLPRASSRWL